MCDRFYSYYIIDVSMRRLVLESSTMIAQHVENYVEHGASVRGNSSRALLATELY